ncbi:MAG: hypothetical protein ABWY11_17495 [Umezawaea sp.]
MITRRSLDDPVTPALTNALRDATGIRFTELPLTADRVWLALDQAGSAGAEQVVDPRRK